MAGVVGGRPPPPRSPRAGGGPGPTRALVLPVGPWMPGLLVLVVLVRPGLGWLVFSVRARVLGLQMRRGGAGGGGWGGGGGPGAVGPQGLVWLMRPAGLRRPGREPVQGSGRGRGPGRERARGPGGGRAGARGRERGRTAGWEPVQGPGREPGRRPPGPRSRYRGEKTRGTR